MAPRAWSVPGCKAFPASRRGALARAFKTGDLELPETLPQIVEDALTRVLLDRLGLEMRVGGLILGTQRIAEAARSKRLEKARRIVAGC